MEPGPVVGESGKGVSLAEMGEDAALEPAVGEMHRTPRVERPLGGVLGAGGGMKAETYPATGEPGGQLHVLGAAEGGIESAGGEDLLAGDRGIAGPELPEGRLPFAAAHRAVLLLEHRLLPGDPGLRIAGQRTERAHYRAARLRGLRAQVLADQLGAR